MKVHPAKTTNRSHAWKLLGSTILFLGLVLGSVTISRADSDGLVLDTSGTITQFNADALTKIGNDILDPTGSPLVGLTGDCVISSDGLLGVTSNGSGLVNLIDMTSGAIAPTAPFGSNGYDLALSQDQFVLMTSGGFGTLDDIYVYDRSSGALPAAGLGSNFLSVEACDDPDQITAPVENFVLGGRFFGVDILEISATGSIQTVIPNIFTFPNFVSNLACKAVAGGQRWGLITGSVSMSSISVPAGFISDTFNFVAGPTTGMGGQGMSAAFSADGTKAYARTTQGVEAFTFDTATGALSWDWSYPKIDNTLFGIERIAVHPVSGNIFFTGDNGLTVLNSSGALVAPNLVSTVGTASGVCLGPAGAGPAPGLVATLSSSDLAIEVKGDDPAIYKYTLTYTNTSDSPIVIVNDIVPKQWDLTLADISESVGTVELNSKNNGNGPHEIIWTIPATTTSATLTVTATTAEKGNGNNTFHEPTHCGSVYVSESAISIDTSTNNELFDPTSSLCLAAVKGPGVDPTGAGNYDGDGFTDYEEACMNEVETDPCSDDTDGDGFLDGIDDDFPLDPTQH
jgi:hypothetical protein